MANRTKYVTIESPGKLNILGGILGPIKTPCYLDIDIVVKLINMGKIVYEVNPTNIKDRVRLNRSNVLKTIFTYPVRKSTSAKKTNTIKVSDVGLSKAVTTPSTVETTISSETGESIIGVDIFKNNKNV